MKKKITKKEIVKLLLNQNLEEGNEEELMDSLVKEPVAIDIIKEDEESKSFGERLADKLTKVAGSWSCLLCFILFLIVWIVMLIKQQISIVQYKDDLKNLSSKIEVAENELNQNKENLVNLLKSL